MLCTGDLRFELVDFRKSRKCRAGNVFLGWMSLK